MHVSGNLSSGMEALLSRKGQGDMTRDRSYRAPCAKHLDSKENLLQADCVPLPWELNNDAQEDGLISPLECPEEFEYGKSTEMYSCRGNTKSHLDQNFPTGLTMRQFCFQPFLPFILGTYQILALQRFSRNWRK